MDRVYGRTKGDLKRMGKPKIKTRRKNHKTRKSEFKRFSKMITPLIEESIIQHHLASPGCGLFDIENKPDGCYCDVCGFQIFFIFSPEIEKVEK